MIFFPSFIHCLHNDYISNIINEPVSIVLTMHPLEKIVFNNDSDNIEVVNMNNIASSDIKNFVSYAYLRKRSHGFLIEYEEKFIRIDRYQKANLTLRNLNASVFKILPSQIGYTIESDGLCLTKDDENDGLSLKRCYLEQADKSCQLFDFIALDRAFYKNLIDLDSESPLDSADYSEINESDFDLEKKFRQTIFDKQFIDSMKYFYDAAACVLKKILKVKKRIHLKMRIAQCQIIKIYLKKIFF